MNDKINVGVTGTGSLIGQAIIKSVQRSPLNEQINLIGFDYFKSTVGSFWCSQNYILPDLLNPNVSEKEWLESLIHSIDENKIKILFAGVDFELAILAKYKKTIETQTTAIVMVCSPEVVSIADDKYLTYQFLKKNNFYYPESWVPGEVDFGLLNYPLIVKPRIGARSVGVSKVNNRNELLSAMDGLKNPMIQECIGNDEDEFTCGTIYLEGELKTSIVLNRSLKGGNTYISRYKEDYPEIVKNYLKEVCVSLKPFGACNFQLRIDKEGIPKIFEINARHSGTTYIRSLFGFKEVEYIINYLLFGKMQAFTLKEGTVVRYYDAFYIP